MAIRPRSVLVAVALVAALLCHLHRTPVVLAQPSAGADGEGIVLHGRVLAGDGSTTPLPGARVSVVADGRATAPVASDGEGRFTLSAPARDDWSLRVTKAGFAPADIVVARPAAEPIAIRLAPGAVITGHVVDERGAPVSGVTVHAWPERCPDACQTPVPLPVLAASARSATTDDRGEYRIGSLPAGTHEIWIGGSVPAFVADQLSGTGVPEPDARVRLGPGDATALSHVHPTTDVPAASARTGVRPGVIDRTGGSIRGRILDAAGRPIAGASVHVEEIDTAAARTGRSDTGGRYEVTGLPPGRFSLTVSRTGQPPVRLGQQHASQQGTPISLRAFETLDGVDVVLPRPGVITGRVVDLHGEPIEGATVRIWERRFAGGRVTLAPAGATLVRTDDRGHYRAHGLLPGTYYAMASDASMAPQSRTGLVVQSRAPPAIRVRRPPTCACSRPSAAAPRAMARRASSILPAPRRPTPCPCASNQDSMGMASTSRSRRRPRHT